MWSLRNKNDNFELSISSVTKICISFLICIATRNGNSLGSRICATFNSQDAELEEQTLTIMDGNVIGNIGEEFATATQSWNTKKGYWNVSSGCQLTACKNLYLAAATCAVFRGSRLSTTPPSHWQSASCTCDKQCHCSNIRWKRNVCAHTYLVSDGCQTCDAKYIELVTSNTSFPKKWRDKIDSFVARAGCEVVFYKEENYSQPYPPKAWGAIGSYKCFCGGELYENSTLEELPEEQERFAVQLKVPDSLDEIVSQLRIENYDHPGLLAGFSSLNKKRSPKNAYILILGSFGAGKSRVINTLLNNDNVTFTEDGKSTTSEIVEFHVPIPVPELGVTNSELRIIDTPGLGDTKGLEHDAVFLATLDTYLSQHSELKNKIPNLVLIFHHFTDNRYNGEGAKFVNMIRGLDTFRTRITDENYSNVLFVFTHFCSENSKSLLQNPSIKLMKFKEVIEEYSLFPKPILTSVIENKGKENELLMVNDNYVLPNNEYFPSNLINKFDTITMKGNDNMGRAIISTAFRNRIEHTNVSESRFSLVNSNHPKVAKYLHLLSSSMVPFANTEISQHLSNTFNRMLSNLKRHFPTNLYYLQKFFNLNHLYTKADLPHTTVKVLELLATIEKNEAVSYMLDKGLNINPPSFPRPIIVSYSFNFIKNSFLPTSPYQLKVLKISEIGYKLPEAITCKQQLKISNMLKIYDTKEQYVSDIASRFGINVSVTGNPKIFSEVNNKIENGIFIKDTSCSNNVCSFVASRFYQWFEFDLNENAILSPNFIKRVTNLSAFDESNYESVKLWNNFFHDYGTHVVKSVAAGGRIDIHVRSPSTISVESFEEKLFQTIEFVEDVNVLITGEKIDPKRLLPKGVTYSFKYHGGSPSYHTSNLAEQNLENAIENMKNWIMSLKYDPVVFPKEFISIHQVAEAISTEKAEYIREASLRLQNSSLSYHVAPTPNPKVLVEELRRAQRENEETLKQLAAEIKHKKESQISWSSVFESLDQSQRELQLERERLKVKGIREEQARQQQLERERRRFLQQQQEERRHAELAAMQRKLEHDQRMEEIRQEEQAKLREEKIQKCCRPWCEIEVVKKRCERWNNG